MSRLDLASKVYRPTIWPIAQRVAVGETLPGPLVVDLDPTTFCDLACPECISARVLNTGRFTKERLAEIAGELVDLGVQAVVLIGGGEPLAHPGTRAVIRVLGEHKVAVGVVTNGTMIDRHLTELATYTSWVRVSVDAASAETFGIFRPNKKGGSQFDRVITNMRRLAASTRGHLGYSYLVMTRTQPDGTIISNHREVLQAAKLAKSIGCHYFELKMMFDDGHFLVKLPTHIMDEVRGQLEQARALEDDAFEVVCSSTYTSLNDDDVRVQTKEYHTCKVAELRTLITPNGVYPCSYHRGNHAVRLGDPVTKSIGEIWRTSPRSIVDPSRDCRFHCARHDTNLALSLPNGLVPRPQLTQDLDADPFI